MGGGPAPPTWTVKPSKLHQLRRRRCRNCFAASHVR
jgi:hypothetical protein